MVISQHLLQGEMMTSVIIIQYCSVKWKMMNFRSIIIKRQNFTKLSYFIIAEITVVWFESIFVQWFWVQFRPGFSPPVQKHGH